MTMTLMKTLPVGALLLAACAVADDHMKASPLAGTWISRSAQTDTLRLRPDGSAQTISGALHVDMRWTTTPDVKRPRTLCLWQKGKPDCSSVTMNEGALVLGNDESAQIYDKAR